MRDDLNGLGFPIRKSTDQSLLAAPHGLSQRVTSFIASQRQGIHQMPFKTLDRTVRKGKSRVRQPSRLLQYLRILKDYCEIQSRRWTRMAPQLNPAVLDVFTNYCQTAYPVDTRHCLESMTKYILLSIRLRAGTNQKRLPAKGGQIDGRHGQI